MKKIIGKLDLEMFKLGQIDPKLALNLWYRICENKTILNNAIELVEDKNKNKCFFAPAICHMILSNPWDVDKEIYDKLVLTLLKDCSLNKITVFNNMTFLSLIILNGALGFDEWYLKLINKNIRNRTKDGNFEMRLVKYHDIASIGEKEMSYETRNINISLTNSEIEEFLKGCHFDIEITHSFKEVEKLVEITNMFPTLDEKIVRMIDLFNQFTINYKRYHEQVKENEALKL